MLHLNDDLTTAVLDRLGLPLPERPDRALLDELIWRYTQTVPWESASRIARRAVLADTADCPRSAAQFWQDHLALGTGGTCFESNLAFFALLRALGYDGYLTINNMGTTQACHTAIVIRLDGAHWLVDAGLPLHRPLRVDPVAATRRATAVLDYSVRPDGPFTYQIEREPHPMRNAFTLVDLPVDGAAYWQATTNDYGRGGLFLDKVVVNKVLDGVVWRFNSTERPWHLERFAAGVRTDVVLEGDLAAVATAVAQRFGIDPGIVRAALFRLEAGAGD